MRVLCLALIMAGLSLMPDDRMEETRRRLGALTRDFEGTVVLYAKNLDTGAEIGIEPDARVRTASTIKLPIFCALAAQAAAGRVSWSERITLREQDKVTGTGVLQVFGDGAVFSLRDLAVLMIVVSDNTATNLVLDRIGADSVNDYMDTLGLGATRALRKIRQDGSPPSGMSRAGREPGNERFGLGVSTPREMVRLLEMLEQGRVVNAEVSRDILAVLERQQYKDGIGRRAGDMRVASKSGSLDALRSDAGIVYSPAGRIAMAVTVDGMPAVDYSPDNAGNRLIWEISRVLVEGLGRTR